MHGSALNMEELDIIHNEERLFFCILTNDLSRKKKAIDFAYVVGNSFLFDGRILFE